MRFDETGKFAFTLVLREAFGVELSFLYEPDAEFLSCQLYIGCGMLGRAHTSALSFVLFHQLLVTRRLRACRVMQLTPFR